MQSFSASEWLAIIAAIGLQVATILGLILTHMDSRARTTEQTRQLEQGQAQITTQVSAKLEDGIKSVGLDSNRKLDTIITAQANAATVARETVSQSALDKTEHIVSVVDDTHEAVKTMNTEGVKVKQ